VLTFPMPFNGREDDVKHVCGWCGCISKPQLRGGLPNNLRKLEVSTKKLMPQADMAPQGAAENTKAKKP